MRPRFFSLSNDSFRGSIWSFLYGLLIVLVCPVLLDLKVSRYAISAAALVILPAVASLILQVAKQLMARTQ